MRLPVFQYFGPKTQEEALALLEEHQAKIRIIAGGTDIINRMRQRLVTVPYVMSLKGIPGLRGTKRKRNEFVVSAGTTLREIIESPDAASLFGSIARSAYLVAAPPIQNMATIGGNLLQNTRCLFYNQSALVREGVPACVKQGGKACIAVKGSRHCFSVYQGDMAPSLIAFNAKALLQSVGGSRSILVADLFSGKGKQPLAISNNELLTHIVIPIPKGRYGSSYQKLRMRSGLEYPLIGASAFISLSPKGTITAARLVIGAVGPAPLIVSEAASLLVGRRPEEADVEGVAEAAFRAAQPVNNLALPAPYRRKMVRVFAKRALNEALEDAQRKGA